MIWTYLAMSVSVVLAVVCGWLIWRLNRASKKRNDLRSFSTRLLEAREHERRQIAEELHDSLGQDLLIIDSRAKTGLASAGGTPAAQQFAEISKICSSAIESVRGMAHSLGPSYLGQLGLMEAMEAMIDRVAASTGLRIEHRFEPVNDLFASDSATSVYRIVQEALNNIIKHSQATEVRIQIIRDVRHVELIIQDNGCGFDPTHANGKGKSGIGLLELGERARMLGGKLDVQSNFGKGTKLSVIVPFPEEVQVLPMS